MGEERRNTEHAFSELEQPDGSFRFSADALLLSDFTGELHLPENTLFADLGTGCGIIALLVLKKNRFWRGAGLEIQKELTDAARRNAELLGLGSRFFPVDGDVCSPKSLRAVRSCFLQKEAKTDLLPMLDAVFCNPPWRRTGDGRMPESAMRRKALFGTEHTLPSFFAAADALLKNGGVLAAVCGAERTADLLEALPSRLHPERLRFVFTRRGGPATFVLLMARKNGRGKLRVDKLET